MTRLAPTPTHPRIAKRGRLISYVRRFHARFQEWPTVRKVAKDLKLRQGYIEAEAGVLPLMLTAYNAHPPEPLGNHFVEICE